MNGKRSKGCLGRFGGGWAWGVALAGALGAGWPVAAAPHTLVWNGTGWDGGWSSTTRFPSNTDTDTYSLQIDGGKAADSTLLVVSAFATLDSIVIDAGDTFAIGEGGSGGFQLLTGITVNGTLRGASSYPPTLALPANQGLAGTGHVINFSVSNAGGAFSIGAGLTVRASNPYENYWTPVVLGGAGQPISNEGHVLAERGGLITLRGGTIANTGRIEAVDGGVVAFDVPLTTITGLGQLASSGGGRFRLAQGIDNTGRTLALDASTGDWEIAGTMKGGTLTTADGRGLYVPRYTVSAVFDGVTINGDLHLDGYDVEFRNSPVLTGNGRIFLDGLLVDVRTTAASLVIGPGLTVVGRRYDGYPGGIGDTTRPTVNQGRLTTEGPGGVLQVNGSSFSNEGRIDVGVGGVLAVNAPFRVSDLGTFTNAGAIRVAGTLDNAGQTLALTPAMGDWELAGTIRGGSIETPAGHYLTIPEHASGGVLTGVLDGVQLNGRLKIGKPGPFGYRFPAHLKIPAGQVLGGTGDVLFATLRDSTVTGDGGLTIGAGMTVHGTGGVVGDAGQPLVNHGLVSADVVPAIIPYGVLPGHGDLTVAGSTIHNEGTFEVRNGGALRFFGDYKLADLGRVVNAGGVIRFDGTLENTGQVLEVSEATGARELVGRLKGGTIRSDAAHPLVVPGVVSRLPWESRRVMDGVTLDGYLRVEKYPLAIAGGLNGRGEIQLGEEGGLSTAEPSLVVGPELTIRSVGRATTVSAAAVINRGEIGVEGGSAYLTFDGDLINEGTIHIGWSGDLAAKTFRMADDAVLSIVLDGSFYDEVYAAAGVDLSGSGDALELVMGPDAKLNTRYRLMTWGGELTGVFDRVTPGFVLEYSTSGRAIFVTAVPEPGGWWGGAGAVGVLAGRRRRGVGMR